MIKNIIINDIFSSLANDLYIRPNNIRLDALKALSNIQLSNLRNRVFAGEINYFLDTYTY